MQNSYIVENAYIGIFLGGEKWSNFRQALLWVCEGFLGAWNTEGVHIEY